jgi:hypothetical protein
MNNDFNFDKIFSDMLSKLNQSGNIVNEYYIKHLIEDWKIKYFKYGENKNVTNESAINKLQKITEKLVLSMPMNIMYTIMGINKIEVDNAMKDEFCSNSLFLCMFCFSIYRFFSKKMKSPTEEELVFSNLTATMLENVKGIIFSYMTNDSLTVIQKIRIVYECYVIFLFLNKHKELVNQFLDHIKIVEYKIFKDIPGYNHEQIIDDNNYEYFAWTKKVIPEKTNRNLAFLAKDVGIGDDMSLVYKLSSNYIHTNAYSAFIKKAMDKNYVRAYLPLVTDITIRQIDTYVKIVNKISYQNEMISILLNRLENILFPESIFKVK